MAFVSNYGAVTVGSTATLVLASNPERKGCLIVNNGSSTIYLGMDSSVTTSTGLPIASNANLNNSGADALWKGAIYAICSSGTDDVRFWEWGA